MKRILVISILTLFISPLFASDEDERIGASVHLIGVQTAAQSFSEAKDTWTCLLVGGLGQKSMANSLRLFKEAQKRELGEVEKDALQAYGEITEVLLEAPVPFCVNPNEDQRDAVRSVLNRIGRRLSGIAQQEWEDR
jgi:hypothetical protein